MLSREKVEAVLFKMGMPANVKGFGYIVDSVLLLEEDSKIKTTYLYFKVAQQHGTTGQRVAWMIFSLLLFRFPRNPHRFINLW